MTGAARQFEIFVCRDADALAEEAADRIVAEAQAAISVRGRFLLVLSGGSTPQRTYEILARPEGHLQIDWAKTWLFFGDERCVPPDDVRSNYRMAAEALITPIGIAADHVLQMRTEVGSPAQSAVDYERRLKTFFGSANGFPHFDLILLGLGDDGHTASLFPGKPTLNEKASWITWSPPGVLPPPVDRVTLTYPVLNAACAVMFLVSGEKKADVVREVLETDVDFHARPAAGVKPTDGQLTWMLDEPAAAKLKRLR